MRSANRMLDRSAELTANLRQVTNDVAHDLRTPLSRLRNRLEQGASPDTPDDIAKQTLADAVVDVDGLLDLFAALLRISQVEAGARRAAFAWIDLSGLVRDVVETFAPAVEDDGRRLRTDVVVPHLVHGDRELLVQLVVNLVENATRHTPRGTVVTIGITDEDGVVTLSVADNGGGIGNVDPALITQRFRRLDPSRSGEGHGLGLALVDAITRLHDAVLGFSDNHPGLNVTVVFRKRAWVMQ